MRPRILLVVALLSSYLCAACGNSSDGGNTGAGGATTGAGGHATGAGGANAGAGGTTSTGAGGATSTGAGGTTTGAGGATSTGAGGAAAAGTDAATGTGGADLDGGADAPVADAALPDAPAGDAASGGDGGLAGTPSRPQLTPDEAAGQTILAYLAQAGSLVTGLTTDNWNPTAGVGDVTTFVPTYTVAASGGTHTTVQAAISAAMAAGGSSRVYIQIMPGTYRETVCIKSTAPPITLYSTSADATQTVIVNGNSAGTLVAAPLLPNPCTYSTTPADGAMFGTSGSSTFAAYAKSFQAKNLTIANDFAEGTATSNVQAVALTAQADQLIFENVRLLGNQDTLQVKSGNVDTVTRAYFKGSYVEGDVDFIFGRGTMVFDGSEIKYLTARRGSSGGQALAPSTDSRNPYGILVIGSSFTAETGTPNGLIGLGRAWDEGGMANATVYPPAGITNYPNGQALVRDSVLGAHIRSADPWRAAATTSRPFSSTPTAAFPANRLFEFTNSGPGSAPP
jgi:pectinesterase